MVVPEETRPMLGRLLEKSNGKILTSDTGRYLHMGTLNAASATIIHMVANCFRGLGETKNVLISALTAGVFTCSFRSRENVIVIFFP